MHWQTQRHNPVIPLKHDQGTLVKNKPNVWAKSLTDLHTELLSFSRYRVLKPNSTLHNLVPDCLQLPGLFSNTAAPLIVKWILNWLIYELILVLTCYSPLHLTPNNIHFLKVKVGIKRERLCSGLSGSQRGSETNVQPNLDCPWPVSVETVSVDGR